MKSYEKPTSALHTLIIQNFQSHRDTRLTFAPGVNALIGPTDSGKSSILRAINWVVNNRPSGEAFRSSWGGDTLVNFTVAEGQQVIRRRTEKENKYQLDLNKEKRGIADFNAIGQTVPDEIQKWLNMTDINIQYQLDAPFLLSNSPGEVARYLSKIVNLDKIYSSQANIARVIKQEKADLKQGQFYLAECLEEIETFDWLAEAEGQLTVLENLSGQISQIKKDVVQLESLKSNIDRIFAKQNILKKLFLAEAKLSDLTTLQSEISKIRASSEELRYLYTKVKNIDSRLYSVRSQADLEHKIDPYLKINIEIKTLTKKRDSLAEIIKIINQLQTNQQKIQGTIKANQKRLDQTMPDICPLCGQEILTKRKRRRRRQT